MSVWRAASEGNAKQLSDLLRSGKAGFNITNTLGQTPLHVAVIAGQAECVSVLLADPSLDVNRRDTDLGWTPLHYAIFRKYPRIAVMLAARGAEIDVLDHKGFSPVDLAFVDTYPPPREEIATTRSSASAFDLASLLEEEAVQHKRSPKADEVFGELFTWGEGSNYCLGHGNPNSVSQPKRVANPVLQDDSVVQVSTSDFSTGVVTRSGRLYTFGVGTGGRLGHGDTEIRLVPKRVVGPLLAKRVVCVSMGFAHSAAVADDGSVFTWGSGAFGQLGHGSTEDSLAPRKIRSAFEGQKPIAVAAGRQHTAVLTSKGSVWTFGCGENGELGYLTDALAKKAYCQCTPRQVVGVEAPVVAIAAGKAHTACTTQAGDVYLLGFGSPQARKLFLPAIMPSAFAAYQQQASAAAASSSSSPSRVLPTPVYSISPSQTSFSLLAGDALSASPSSMAAGGSRGQRLLTSLVASGNMTLVVFNRRDVFLSDLYHVDGLHSRIPKPIYIPAIPGNNTIASAALNTNKEIIVATDAGHLWKCVENKEKAREWVWSRISVGRRFSHVACSRNHYAAIGQKEALVKERIDVSPWSLSAHLLKELENDDFTDVEFVMDDGRRVPAHKIVLAMRSRHFASLFATQEEEEEGAEDAAPPVWGESDYFVPGLAPKRKREVAVDQTTYPLFHNFIRLVYTDASDPSTARLTESEKGQVTPLVKRFGVNSLNPSSRDKARSKGKERVVDSDDADDASREASRPPTPDVVAAPSSSSSRFEKELGAAYHDERLTDVDLISSEEDRIACHQVILCSQSEVFRTMMTIGMIESQKSEIFIQNASTETLRKVKEFLYLGNFADLAAAAATVGEGKKPGAREAIPFNTVMELLNISNQFMLRRMKETLEDLLLRQYLDYDNLVSLFITAENYSCHNLKRQLFEFARRNFIALLQGNVVRDLLDHPDYAYLLDDLDYFVQSGGKLRDVDAGDDDGTQAGDTAEEAEQRQAEVDELLTYFSEDEIEHQKQMEAFWERERLIEKEREKQKANEQRRRAAKAHAKFAAKARRGKAARPAAAASKPKAKDDGPAETATSTSTTAASTTTTVEEVEEDPRRAQLRRSVEAANKALGKEYGSNEEALRIVKRLRASKKKLSQIDNLLEKQAKGDELDEDQRAKLDHQQTLEDEIAALLRQLAEATRPPPPAPKKSAPQSAPAEPAPAPAPVGPVAYQKKRDNDDFVSGKAANRNRRRTNSATKAVKAEATTPAQPTPTTTQPAMATVAAPPAPSLAPWAAMKKPAPAAAGAPSPQKAKSLVQIQQEEAAQEMRRRKEAAARGKPAGPATAGTGAPQPQHRTIKRLDGSVEKAIVGQPAPRTQVGGADNDSSSSSKYSISLAIGGKSASSPVRVTMPGVPVQHHQASTTASASSNGGKHAMPALRSSSNGLENSSASRPAAASAAGAAAQQSPSRSATAAAFPPLGASPQRAPSLADIQREERERVEAERKRREVVKPTKKPLKQIQEEQEEARKIQALFGEELKQIYGHDVDLESIW